MDYIYLSVMSSLIGTSSITLVSIYLYILYRKQYMGLWALSWSIFCLRYALLDSGVYAWKQSALGLTFYQLLTYIAVLLLVYSTYSFINKPFNKLWLYGAMTTFLASTVLNYQSIPFNYKLLLPVYSCCLAGIWAGLIFILKRDLRNTGRIVTGYGYLLLSLINFSTPFIMYGSWILPWGYALGGILRLMIAVSTLILYFEKTRKDLSEKEMRYRHLADSVVFERMNMVGNMAATVAHEIRNPMTTVRGYLQMLARNEKYQAESDKFNLMIEELDRANEIIREYLFLSHHKVAALKKCSLNHIIKTLFPLLQTDATASNITLNLDLSDIPEILLDQNEIRQLLLNLVKNSIESMSLGGNLVIRTSAQENKVILSICDQGSGIPPDALEQLGTPFFHHQRYGYRPGAPNLLPNSPPPSCYNQN